MPRDFAFTKEEIVKAGLDLTREKGFDAVSTRAIGEKLGVSSRPVVSRFGNMAEVKKAIISAADGVYQDYIKEETLKGKYPPYKASGMAYVRFAREEKQLFKLLFMRDRSKEEMLEVRAEESSLLRLVRNQTGVDEDAAKLFHLESWVFVHGIASMIATDYLEWDEELISRAMTDMYEGLKSRYDKL